MFAMNEGLLPVDTRILWFSGIASLERGLIFSAVVGFCGMALLLLAVDIWRQTGFGMLDYPATMRLVVPGALLTVLGFQTLLFSFYLSLLSMKRKYRG